MRDNIRHRSGRQSPDADRSGCRSLRHGGGTDSRQDGRFPCRSFWRSSCLGRSLRGKRISRHLFWGCNCLVCRICRATLRHFIFGHCRGNFQGVEVVRIFRRERRRLDLGFGRAVLKRVCGRIGIRRSRFRSWISPLGRQRFGRRRNRPLGCRACPERGRFRSRRLHRRSCRGICFGDRSGDRRVRRGR
jgi:hypothetical protein